MSSLANHWSPPPQKVSTHDYGLHAAASCDDDLCTQHVVHGGLLDDLCTQNVMHCIASRHHEARYHAGDSTTPSHPISEIYFVSIANSCAPTMTVPLMGSPIPPAVVT
jgi:hypothetical protein